MQTGSAQGQQRVTTRHIKKSSFVAQLDLQRNQRILGQSRKQLSHSTLLDQPFQPLPRKHNVSPTGFLDRPEDGAQLFRARSLKSIHNSKPVMQTADKSAANDLSENMLRLKVEEMTFKFKTRMGCLLKEMGISEAEQGRFSGLNKIDDMLTFLCERVRERLTSSQLSEASFLKAHLREKEAVNSHEVEMEMLRRRLEEREGSERQLKSKLRQAHNESRQLFERVNLKERELSAKVTEIYQQKVFIKEQQKMIKSLQERCEMLQKQGKEMTDQVTADSKGLIGSYKQLQQENSGLGRQLEQLREQVERGRKRQKQLQQSSQQMAEELSRWRQRFEDSRSTVNQPSQQKSSEGATNQEMKQSVRVLKKSSMSMSNNCYLQSVDRGGPGRFSVTALELENMKLSMRVQELEKQNKQLSRDMLNYATVKERYQQTLATAGEGSQSGAGEGELEEQHRKRLEEVAGEWKTKLYQIVYKYEDELDAVKLELSLLTADKQLLEKKLFTMANEKYQVENLLIEKEKEMYMSSRQSRSPSSIGQPTQHNMQNDYMFLSAAEIMAKQPQPHQLQPGEGQNREGAVVAGQEWLGRQG